MRDIQPTNTFAAALFVVLSTTVSASNFLPGLTYMSPKQTNVVWPKLPVNLCTSKSVPKNISDNLPKAMAVWNESLGTQVFTSESCNPLENLYQETDLNTRGIYWITEGFERFTDKTSLARTIVQYDDLGNLMDADILLNGQYYEWHKLLIDPQTILIHELGHVLGLKHYFLSLDSAMNYFSYVSGHQHRSIGSYERLVFDALYKKNNKPTSSKVLEYYFSNDFKKAIDELEKTKDKNLETFYALGVLYKSLNNNQLATKNFTLALKARPKDPIIKSQLADLYWNSGNIDAAEKEFLEILELKPSSYEALANLGSIYIEKKQSKKGVEYLKKSLAIQPAHWPVCQILFNETKEKKYKDCYLRYQPSPKN
jgi:tetratricopeptide (TPR) repeat protein